MKMQGPYWVYIHTTPDGMVYVGYSKQKYFNSRCRENQYSTTSLQPYIEKYGWDNIEHFFIDGINTKESAMKLEGDLIKMYSEKGVCININDSGSWSLDKKKYEKQRQKKYYENHKEKLKEYSKKYYEEHKEEIKENHKEYSKKYYEEHKEEIKKNNKEYRKKYYKEHKQEILEKKKKEYQRRKIIETLF